MQITSDWHIHSEHSCDEACLEVAELPRMAAGKGVRDFGLTDHVHTPFNLPDLAASRQAFLASGPSARFHFGVEVSCVSKWELDELSGGGYDRPTYGIRGGGPAGCELAIGLTGEDIRSYGVEYVVAGTHWPMYVPFEREAVIRDYHRQNMFLACHPLVTIVAHPWWWMGHWQNAGGMYLAEPWFDDFGVVPQSMHDEFASALVQHGKVAEINLGALVLSPVYPEPFKVQYLDYLGWLKSRGVKLSIGSDCHERIYDVDMGRASAALDSVGITESDLWTLPARS